MRETDFQPFANRLEKVYRHIGKWARKQGITCFRVYDNDMPEFPFAIDYYDGLLHVSEYSREHLMDTDEHAQWLDGCMAVMANLFEIDNSKIYFKFRQRQSGLQQYERFDRKGEEVIVSENGLQFIINPADYLDTGLFLDHRNTREMVRSMSKGKSVLNLFAYTGSFTVYAADGGAVSTDTLDLSNTYLAWAERNLELNGFKGSQHQFLQADVLEWLGKMPARKWDIIVFDPPTFSNSKRMRDTLDIQRDHVWMLRCALSRLAPGGTLFFSTNMRKFKLDMESLSDVKIKNISAQTVPNDFREKRIHQCYLIQH